MADVKYKYAFIDGNKEVPISINEITEDNRNQYKFRCIGCGRELLPRAIGSKYKRAHFYHKEELECSGETYLHKLAKHIIKEKFDSEATFFVEYPVTRTCDKEECEYRNHRCQEENVPYKIDLKKYYDTCTEEVPVNGFVADLLLTNSKKPDTDPTLIEVCVSNPCDEMKRNSGLRIIEIKIKKEEDIINLQKGNNICESLFAPKKERNVEFISFKRTINSPLQIKLQRYVFDSRKNPNGYLTEVNCNDAHKKIQTDSMVELNVYNTMSYLQCSKWDVLLWMYKNKGLRRCNLCKFYYATQYESKAICRLSKKYGKPACPPMDEAEKCRSFSFKERCIYCYTFIFEEITGT